MVDQHIRQICNASATPLTNSEVDFRCGNIRNRITVIRTVIRNAAKRLKRNQPLVMPELLLCEAVHQISLCIGCQQDNRAFLSEFRSRFRKQQHIAQNVLGPLIVVAGTTNHPGMAAAVQCFGTYGYVHHNISVPLNMMVAVAIACDHCKDEDHEQESLTGKGISNVTELLSALDFLSTKCSLLYGLIEHRGLKRKSQMQALEKEEESLSSSSSSSDFDGGCVSGTDSASSNSPQTCTSASSSTTTAAAAAAHTTRASSSSCKVPRMSRGLSVQVNKRRS